MKKEKRKIQILSLFMAVSMLCDTAYIFSCESKLKRDLFLYMDDTKAGAITLAPKGVLVLGG